VKFTVFC